MKIVENKNNYKKFYINISVDRMKVEGIELILLKSQKIFVLLVGLLYMLFLSIAFFINVENPMPRTPFLGDI
ncbi:hypothetical protein SAMN04487943_101646 [Gracilibacillus orientalis]|uniref:Uncharacterized protein n=1 Tax=Gracilibacillus orientalis TaxID=334253 RepID=A0A1I4HW67_9BACI|nr:hypothetical protein SAMN04487943_101646 [Gracilibacillus orientalis]